MAAGLKSTTVTSIVLRHFLRPPIDLRTADRRSEGPNLSVVSGTGCKSNKNIEVVIPNVGTYLPYARHH